MDLLNLKSTDLLREPPRVDDILLCGACGTLSVVTLLGTAPLSAIAFAKLSADEKKELDFAARAVKRNLESN